MVEWLPGRSEGGGLAHGLWVGHQDNLFSGTYASVTLQSQELSKSLWTITHKRQISYVQVLAQANSELPRKENTGHMASKYMRSWMTRNMEEPFGRSCLLTSWKYLSLDGYWQDNSNPDGSPVIVSKELWLQGGISSLCYWRRLLVTPRMGSQVFVLQWEIPLLSHSWYSQRAHSFVFVPSRACYLQKLLMFSTSLGLAQTLSADSHHLSEDQQQWVLTDLHRVPVQNPFWWGCAWVCVCITPQLQMAHPIRGEDLGPKGLAVTENIWSGRPPETSPGFTACR